MPEGESSSSGFRDSLRRIGDSIHGLVHTRVELFSVELREEKLRFIELAILLAVGLCLLTAGLLVGVGTLALLLWQTAGYAGLVGLLVACLAVAAVFLGIVYRKITRGPGPFSETVAEFEKDIACFHRD